MVFVAGVPDLAGDLALRAAQQVDVKVRDVLEVDVFAQLGIELETGVVGHAGKVNDRMASRQTLFQQRAIADISLDLLETGITAHGVQNVVSVQIEVQDLDLVISGKKFRYEHA